MAARGYAVNQTRPTVSTQREPVRSLQPRHQSSPRKLPREASAARTTKLMRTPTEKTDEAHKSSPPLDQQSCWVSTGADDEKCRTCCEQGECHGECWTSENNTDLTYTEVQAGTGDAPSANDRVRVHYHGTLSNGAVFDSSMQRGQTVVFPLSGVIACWRDGVQKMREGGTAKFICPPETAYGDRGTPPLVGPGATLFFEVHLIEIIR